MNAQHCSTSGRASSSHCSGRAAEAGRVWATRRGVPRPSPPPPHVPSQAQGCGSIQRCRRGSSGSSGSACHSHSHSHSRHRRRIRLHALPHYDEGKPPARLAVFVSGGGSNMKAIHAAILGGQLYAELSVVVSDKPSCNAVAYAEQHGIPTLTFPIPKGSEHPGLTTQQVVQELQQRADFVILAGYLKLIPGELTRAFPRAMLNIHPGLLPAFGGKGMYGERVHKAVIASGARFSGPTVHFVDEGFDTGPILAQAVVPVRPTDMPKRLAARVLTQEHLLLPMAVSALVDGRITWREDGIPILWNDQ